MKTRLKAWLSIICHCENSPISNSILYKVHLMIDFGRCFDFMCFHCFKDFAQKVLKGIILCAAVAYNQGVGLWFDAVVVEHCGLKPPRSWLIRVSSVREGTA